MRVLHIITRLDPGGSATNTIVSVDRLRKQGIDTCLAYGPTRNPHGSIEEKLEEMSVNRVFMPHLVRDISPVKDLRAFHDIKRLLTREQFDLVHTHTSKAGVFGRIAAHRLGIPVVHTPHGHVFYGYFGPALTRLFVSAERYLARKTDRIVSLTDIETDESLARGIGRREQYTTIHSGVPLSDFIRRLPGARGTFRSRHGIPEESLLFVSVGRLTRVKGFDILLDAFARADFGETDTRLLVVGRGGSGGQLQSQASKLKVAGRVKFVGQLEDVREALWAADAFVLASRNEGMGRVIVEAMAAGLPVVAAAAGGIPSLVEDGRTGLLADAEDAGSLAHSMEKLRDGQLRARIAAAGTNSVYPKYDEKTMIDDLARLYREVLEARKAGGKKE